MQINRLFQIIYILLENKLVTAGELAERLNVSVRTIYRDIENLSSAGIPVYMSKGKGGGISILPDFILNKALLTQEEKQDILSSIRAVGAVSLNKNMVTFDYSSGKRECIRRTVCQLKLYFKGQSWYVYGFCKLRDDYRFFKLSRIKNIVISDEKFEIRCPDKIFNKKNVFELVNVKMKISKEMAYRVYDEFEDIEELKDGDFIVSMNFPMGEWLYSYIYTFGEYAEVLEPLKLRLFQQGSMLSFL